jgi:hypothetical protein
MKIKKKKIKLKKWFCAACCIKRGCNSRQNNTYCIEVHKFINHGIRKGFINNGIRR